MLLVSLIVHTKFFDKFFLLFPAGEIVVENDKWTEDERIEGREEEGDSEMGEEPAKVLWMANPAIYPGGYYFLRPMGFGDLKAGFLYTEEGEGGAKSNEWDRNAKVEEGN